MNPLIAIVNALAVLFLLLVLFGQLARAHRAESALAAERAWSQSLRERLAEEKDYAWALAQQLAELGEKRETLIEEILTLKRDGFEVDTRLAAVRGDESWGSYQMDDVRSSAPKAEAVEVIL